MRRVLAFALLATAAAAQAAEECERHGLTSYPFLHRPSAEQAAALKDCDAAAYYYGIGTRVDYARARQCAFAKGSHDILMMLYANGNGVPRNYPVAKMAACLAQAEPAETEARLAHLARMQAGREGLSPSMDICDDAASTALDGRCQAIRAALEEQALDEQLERLTTRWTTSEQEAAQQMWKHARTFGKADALASLRAFETGKLPVYSQDDLQRAERAAKGNMPPAWLAYRDAWVALGKLRYPAVPQHAWKAYFTLKRAPEARN